MDFYDHEPGQKHKKKKSKKQKSEAVSWHDLSSKIKKYF